MLKENTLKEDEISYRLGHSFCQEVVKYIERCHLEDGGYFFARVPPSSGMDTYHAVKSLAILGKKPECPDMVANFFLEDIKNGSWGGIPGVFITTAVLDELGQLTSAICKYAKQRIMATQNRAGGFGAYKNIDVETSSELEGTYRAVWVLKTTGADFDKQKVINFVSRFLNNNGGYGSRGHPTLASTFYATAIYRLLDFEIRRLAETKNFLRNCEENWQVNFIEDLFWLIKALSNIREKCRFPDKAIEFVRECQRSNGGFSRGTVIGIPTLEYTYYALSILREVGAL